MIRAFTPDDHDEVSKLVLFCGQGDLPRRLGGIGFVLEEDSEIVGFVWALVSKASELALIEYFCVEESKQKEGRGLLLMTSMIAELGTLGIKRVVGIVREGAPAMMARIYHKNGMDVGPAFVLSGDPSVILSKLVRRAA